ncbi:MAG: flagellar motor stator protein MotA [Ignavibacteriae bacterium HGW-Ignavibacteriae-2]|jgi:chemotaxis protein MotA|nr:flagellar motor stator protein MotA [Bacteroidota bacterium]PKL89290.1 MAG: flagellar motor stator protein MotA [Ignavibacteriae bacterium HGW-Ignavibacteriae-2]
MLVIIGLVVVMGSVVAGYTMAHGNFAVLLQWAEFVTIIGAAVGSLIVGSPIEVIKKVITALLGTIKSDHLHKQDYLDILKSFNDLFLAAQRDGLLSIEAHIEKPKESSILSRNKKFIDNEYVTNYFCDTMKILLTGSVPPHELENIIDTEIESFEMENKPVGAAVSKMGDALPGLGIVAAVLGIIITMSSIDKGAAYVGLHVAAALVGTFLGVLLSYGIVGPLAAKIEHDMEVKVRFLMTIKACIVAYAKGNPPIIAVEIARRTIFSDFRPSFSELENYMRTKKE